MKKADENFSAGTSKEYLRPLMLAHTSFDQIVWLSLVTSVEYERASFIALDVGFLEKIRTKL